MDYVREREPAFNARESEAHPTSGGGLAWKLNLTRAISRSRPLGNNAHP